MLNKDINVTAYSTSLLDALEVGVSTILIHPEGKELYSNFINNKNAYYADSEEAFWEILDEAVDKTLVLSSSRENVGEEQSANNKYVEALREINIHYIPRKDIKMYAINPSIELKHSEIIDCLRTLSDIKTDIGVPLLVGLLTNYYFVNMQYEKLKDVIRTIPDYPDAIYYQARLHKVDKNYEQALKTFAKHLEMREKKTAYYEMTFSRNFLISTMFHQGETLFIIGRFEQAYTSFQSANVLSNNTHKQAIEYMQLILKKHK